MANIVGLAEVMSALADEAEAAIQNAKFVHTPVARLLNDIKLDKNFFRDLVGSHNSQLVNWTKHFTPSLKLKSRIPKLYHKIWVTQPDEPSMPPAEFIERLILSIDELPKEWTIIFWTNANAVGEHIRNILARSTCRFLVADLSDALAHDPLHAVACRFLNARKYVVAGDILKVAVLNRFGGLYADVGIQLTRPIFELCEAVDYAFLLGDAVYLQTSLLAAAANSPLFAVMSAMMTRPEAFKRDLIAMEDTFTATDEVRAFSGVGATITMLLFLEDADRTLFLPTKSRFFEWRAQGSWYKGDGMFGNAVVKLSTPTVVDERLFSDFYDVGRLSLRSWNLTELMYHRLTTLLRVQNYFRDNAPELPVSTHHTFSVSRHRFSPFYAYLLRRFTGQNTALVDCRFASKRDLDGFQSSVAEVSIFWNEFLQSTSCISLECHSSGDLTQVLRDKRVDVVIVQGSSDVSIDESDLRAILEELAPNCLLFVESLGRSPELIGNLGIAAEEDLSAALMTLQVEKDFPEATLLAIWRNSSGVTLLPIA